MKQEPVYIDNIDMKSDNRGYLFNVPDQVLEFINKIEEIHLASVEPEGIRGNHYHLNKKEALVISYDDSWTFAWSVKDDTKIYKRNFTGIGHVIIEVDKCLGHAIKNTGKKRLTIVSFTDKKNVSGIPDSNQVKLLI